MVELEFAKEEVTLLNSYQNDYMLSEIAGISRQTHNRDEEHAENRLKHIIKSGHASILEHGIMTFRVVCNLTCARQWFRHRIASYNEKSGRYTKSHKFYIPNTTYRGIYAKSYQQSYNSYLKLIEKGEKLEKARLVLPQGMLTEFIWTVNLRSLINFLNLRNNSHAQEEIRYLANEIEKYFEQEFPIVWKYWRKYNG